jgi:hypothetical protein
VRDDPESLNSTKHRHRVFDCHASDQESYRESIRDMKITEIARNAGHGWSRKLFRWRGPNSVKPCPRTTLRAWMKCKQRAMGNCTPSIRSGDMHSSKIWRSNGLQMIREAPHSGDIYHDISRAKAELEGSLRRLLEAVTSYSAGC